MQVAEKLGNSCCLNGAAYFVPLLNFFCLCNLRGQVRAQHNIEVGIACGLGPSDITQK